MRTINSLLLRLINKILIHKGYPALDKNAQSSFSQMGEDRILAALFSNKKTGFYVDVGAHHPKIYSNTYLFYLQGWRGINIDAMPGSMELFNTIRPRDINVEIPVANKKKVLTYYLFSNSAVNSFSKKYALQTAKTTEHKMIGTRKLTATPLSDILDKYLSENQKIDFISIDVEGLDYEVLQSNNWKKYGPRVVVVEDLLFSFASPNSSKIYKFLHNLHYDLLAKTNTSLIFVGE